MLVTNFVHADAFTAATLKPGWCFTMACWKKKSSWFIYLNMLYSYLDFFFSWNASRTHHWHSPVHHSYPDSHAPGCTGGSRGYMIHHHSGTRLAGMWIRLFKYKNVLRFKILLHMNIQNTEVLQLLSGRKIKEFWLTAVFLIWSIRAVGISVTSPGVWNTLPSATVELYIGAGSAGRWRWLVAAILRPLVWTIWTIGISVTGPQTWQAGWVVAAKKSGAAGSGLTLCFITAIITVSVFVTDESPRHTLTICATEFTIQTLSGSWKRSE